MTLRRKKELLTIISLTTIGVKKAVIVLLLEQQPFYTENITRIAFTFTIILILNVRPFLVTSNFLL